MTTKLFTILSLSLAAAGAAFVMQDDACQQINEPCPVKNAERGSNPPWFPSLMAFEHYDSGRTKVFEQAHFAGSYDGNNEVAVRTAPATYPTTYNMVYLSPDKIFLYGGGYGNIPNATGAFVAKVDPDTLKPIWYKQLINTAETGEWDYPGVVGMLKNGLLYVIYGYRLAKLDPRDGTVIKQVDLPTGEALPRNTSYNGFDALPDGTLIAKTIYREQGCELQGPSALRQCPNPTNVPPSILVSIDPETLEVLDQVTLPTPVGGRPTTARFRDHDYVYFATQTTAIRYLIESGKFTLDESWNPGNLYQPGQTIASAFAVMKDWAVVQTNGLPATTPLSVIAINQGDATRQFSVQPFANFPVPKGFPTSWAPMSMSVDPDDNFIYTADSSPGELVALELTPDGLRTQWTVHQRTTEFLAVIGPRDRRVLVTTAIPPGQVPLQNTTDFVVWRLAQTGRDLAHTQQQLPAITNGTMIQPYYFGKIFYPALDGELIELTARPVRPTQE
jgi:hypothetical protein